MEGSEVGNEDGAIEGRNDGIAVVNRDGRIDGKLVGINVGSIVGQPKFHICLDCHI